ncbi:MAG: hypothetical protein IJ946_05100 [Clostridia bacterium]|nr:hypothetical protein [Clostridia bacterium]
MKDLIASTKQIAFATSINEVYIYRCFADKEDLFAKVFDSLDEELLCETVKRFELILMTDIKEKMRWRLYFSAIWDFLLSDRNECLVYVRYFYSPYFLKHSVETHETRFVPLVNKFKTIFKDEANVWMILNHIFNVMLDFAIKVHNGIMPDTEENSEHVFRVMYESVKQYFRSSKESEFQYE